MKAGYKLIHILSSISLFAGAMTLTWCAHNPDQAVSKLAPGDPFDFELPNLSGELVRAADYRGKVILIDVWATWCAPCEQSFPFYADLHAQWAEQGFEVIAVSVDERSEDVGRWLEGRNLPFIVVHDPEGKTPEDIGLMTMPSAVLVDREGRIVRIHAGFKDEDKAVLSRLIEASVTSHVDK